MKKNEDQLASPFVECVKERVDGINKHVQNLLDKKLNGEICGPRRYSASCVGRRLVQRISSLFK